MVGRECEADEGRPVMRTGFESELEFEFSQSKI